MQLCGRRAEDRALPNREVPVMCITALSLEVLISSSVPGSLCMQKSEVVPP